MTTQQIVIVAASAAIALLALVGALSAWRALARTGSGLRSVSETLDARAQAIPIQLAVLRSQLEQLEVQTERALWMLDNLDSRIDATNADLRAKRLASDSLRVRLISGRLTVARIRQLVRLMIRIGELRRVIL